MKQIDVLTNATEQTQTVELDGIETVIRIYWQETPAHAVSDFGFDGQLFMDITNDIFTINHLAVTTGNELMLPFGYINFGGFIVISDSNIIDISGSEWKLGYEYCPIQLRTNVIDMAGSEWKLYYVEIDELEEIRDAYGSII